MLLEAVTKIAEKFPDLRLDLGGVWEDESFKEKVSKLEENVSFLGWISGKEKEEALRRASVYVLPSYFEGQPLSVLEAMANYCVVVASDTGGIPMMVENEVTGLLVPVKDADAIAEAVIRLVPPAGCKRAGKDRRRVFSGSEYGQTDRDLRTGLQADL